MKDINAVTILGAAAGWLTTLEAVGTKKLSAEEILTPAIKLAEDGYPISELVTLDWQVSEGTIKSASLNGDEMLQNPEKFFITQC